MSLITAFYKFLGSNVVRRYLLKKTGSAVMQSFYSKSFPNRKKSLNDIEIISIDIETTGLNPDKDKIVSIGLVNIEHHGIRLKSCWHQIIKVKKDLSKNSVVIHKITDDQSVTGMTIDKAMPLLLDKLSGKVMLAHNASIEIGFINKVCQRLYGCDFVMPIIDTQLLAKRSLERSNKIFINSDLRLFNLREKFNLPAYKAHNALMDAIAAAELFLLMANKISPCKAASLSEFIC